MADAATGAGRPARYCRICRVWVAAGTRGVDGFSGITDTGCHFPLLRASHRVWNQAMSDPVVVGVAPLSPAEVVAVARHGAPVVLDSAALKRITDTRSVIESLAADPNPHYGVSTG